ncbi:antitoxin VbhA family protein [Rhodococcus sp. APC 3903]|uniref:antitoxin VbhA family protein n=1 Tax=Rhodococcus sp. APC 3903 TaxID=3035193 RepID=UPI0025B2D18A|nr:antitoxin VbhA family protein [Rhodococcus sp. APC 3903]MDN3461026.1 antitoxin VbhA family protein [Rhodococcus sp. APC 3903]
MTDSHLTTRPSSRISQSRLTEGEIDRALAAATAGHRMAGMEPTAADLEIGRRQLRGEITGDEAVSLAIAAALTARNQRKEQCS